MGRQYSFEDDNYSIRVTETAGHIDLHLQFKKTQMPVPQPEHRAGQGQRVTIPANEHHRRQGVYEDEMLILDHGEGCYEVTSRTEPGAFHIVMVDEQGRETCECTAAQFGRLCRHVRGTRILRGLPIDAPLRTPLDQRSADGLDSLPLSLSIDPSD